MKRRLIQLKEIDSTNRYIAELTANADEMVIVTADGQTNGRGQGTNKWESEPGKNLLFSLLLHPSYLSGHNQFLLAMAGSLAVKEALDTYTTGICIKWPNDIYHKDSKISGTLIETRLSGNHIKDFIFGTGINLNQYVFKSDAPNPVSLCTLIGRETPPSEVLDKVLSAFEKYNDMLQKGNHEEVVALYHAALYRAQGFYLYKDKHGIFEAEIVQVATDGHFVLRDRNGYTRRYAFKEVTYVFENLSTH